MAAKDLPYPIFIETDQSRGTVIVENLTQAENNPGENNSSLVGELDSKKQVTLDLANMKINYANGDKIEIRISGPDSATSLHTVNTLKAPGKFKIAQTGTDYAGPSISL